MAGLENVADAADVDGQAGGYPQLSTEYLVEADPDLVFLADTKCCAQDAAGFGDRPGFGALSAVANDHVVLLDDDIASRWGPRIVDLFRTIVESVKAVPAA
jgi:iron complex transport system substrate-binding protein